MLSLPAMAQALLSQNETSLIRENDTLGAPSTVKVGGL